MEQIKSISIVGTGNVAFQIGKSLTDVGFSVKEVYGRNKLEATKLSHLLNCKSVDNLNDLTGDLVILCVKDNAILDVSKQIPSNKVLVHTSGAIAMDVLDCHDQFGVLYPLQTISKHRNLAFQKVPIILESNSIELLNELERISSLLSNRVVKLSSEERKYLHLSAVFVNNFVNHLLFRSKKIMDEKNMDWQLLLPLLQETVDKLQSTEPYDAQTGPARRNDKSTIDNHLSLLSGKDKEIYQLLSDSIKDIYHS